MKKLFLFSLIFAFFVIGLTVGVKTSFGGEDNKVWCHKIDDNECEDKKKEACTGDWEEGKCPAHERVCFCHNVNNNPHTICTDDQGEINGHSTHVNNGTDSQGECPTPTVYHYTACAENSDGFYCKDFTSETPHDSSCEEDSDCDETPTPTCSVTPTPIVYSYTACARSENGPYCKEFTSETPQDSTCEVDSDCAEETPTPTPTATPTPTNTPSNPGGPGDGRSDGRSDGKSDGGSSSPQPSTGAQVLGAATGPQVLGLSTTSGDNNLMNILSLLPGVASAVGGFAFLKKNA